jgi:hypothetical protein
VRFCRGRGVLRMGCELRAAGCELRAAGCGLRAAGCGLRAPSRARGRAHAPTCCGLSSARKCTSVASPCRPPLARLMKTSSGVRSRADSVCGRKVQWCSHCCCDLRPSGESSRATSSLSDTRLTTLLSCGAACGLFTSLKTSASLGRISLQMRRRSASRGATVQSSSSFEAAPVGQRMLMMMRVRTVAMSTTVMLHVVLSAEGPPSAEKAAAAKPPTDGSDANEVSESMCRWASSMAQEGATARALSFSFTLRRLNGK